MFKFIYMLLHEYSDNKTDKGEKLLHSIELGYFSNKKKAKKVIDKYKTKEGFNEHPIKCFKIKRFLLKTQEYNVKNIYELYHSYIDKDGFEEYNYLGVFSDEESALKKQNKLISRHKKYRENAQGFDISEELIDSENVIWAEGFEKL